MQKVIENIRNKPAREKSRIVWLIAGCTAGILLILWAIIGMPHRDGSTTEIITQFNENVEENKDVIPNPFEETK